MANNGVIDNVVSTLLGPWDNSHYALSLLDPDYSDVNPRDFKEALEGALYIAKEDQYISFAKGIVGKILSDSLEERTRGLMLKTNSYLGCETYHEDTGDGSVDVISKIRILTGIKKENGQLISDHKRLLSMFRESTTIERREYDPDWELTFKMKGNPKSKEFREPIVNHLGMALPYTHAVHAVYTTSIPKNILPDNIAVQIPVP